MRSRSFWNRAEYHTLRVVSLAANILMIAIIVAISPIILIGVANKWLIEAIAKRMERLNAIYFLTSVILSVGRRS